MRPWFNGSMSVCLCASCLSVCAYRRESPNPRRQIVYTTNNAELCGPIMRPWSNANMPVCMYVSLFSVCGHIPEVHNKVPPYNTEHLLAFTTQDLSGSRQHY